MYRAKWGTSWYVHEGLFLIREVKAQFQRTAAALHQQAQIVTVLSSVFSLIITVCPWYTKDEILINLCVHRFNSVCVCLQVISGSNLPPPRSGKALDPFVRVEIHGIASDNCKKSTHTVRNGSKYCAWRPCTHISKHSWLWSTILILSLYWYLCYLSDLAQNLHD